MKSLVEILQRWLHPAVFITWTGFLIYLLISRHYMDFLRPEFGLLLALAYFIALGFMFAAMLRPDTTGVDVSAVLRALVLLTPILFFLAMSDNMLGNQAFKKRYIGTGNKAVDQQTPSTPSSQDAESNDPDVASPSEAIEDTRQEAPKEQTLLQILLDPDSYKGQRVIVTGMILHDEQLKPHFGGKDTAIYRFLITCCVADAIPLAIALNPGQADAFDNDQWVRIDGIFDLQQIDNEPVPVLLKPQIKPIQAPEVPYLF